ncbi:pyridoxamine 5'-phosphate oxidase family protein [Nonomuraea cavernae]|uniref:pyridoxamine 5'-phosphate oxidase family protein n=1 Tax=Nonomuraea cavernae TaxID=2045107 RepID=UPI0034095E40
MSQETQGPAMGPPPGFLSDAQVSHLLGEQRFGALATVTSSGHPQMSTVRYTWDPEQRVVRISTIADRPKVRQLHKDPRSALYVAGEGFRSYGVAEGEAELSPVTVEPGDEVGRELLAMRPGFAAPGDEAAFLRRMVDDRRMVIRLSVSRLHGMSL